MYRWILATHVASVFGFLFAHGGSAFASWQLRRERRPEPARALLKLSELSLYASAPFLLLLIASGIALGFMGGWWNRPWVWASIVIFVLVSLAMGFFGGYHRARAVDPAAPVDLTSALDATHPNLLLVIGMAGLLVLFLLVHF